MASEEQAKIKLFWLDRSRSQRILWLLEELKVQYDVQIFHRNKETLLAPPELEKVHPLGKSPVVHITPPGAKDPVVLAESGFMTQFLVEHFPEGKRLMPQQWKEGQEGKVGGETDAWLRYQYFLHYCEGSFMFIMVLSLVISRLKSNQVPFIARPITSIVANRIFAMFIFPNAKRHLKFLEQQLETSSGKYLCNDQLTAVDILMSFGLIAGKGRFDEMGSWEGGSWTKTHPRLVEYINRLENDEGYKRSVEKAKELNGGEFSSNF